MKNKYIENIVHIEKFKLCFLCFYVFKNKVYEK